MSRAPLRASFLERLFAGHHDVVAALRSLRRSPAFVAIAVLSLGLAIGLNTTTFAMLDAITNPYLPFSKPAELATVKIDWAKVRGHPGLGGEMYVDLRARRDLYQALVPWTARVATVEAGDHLVSGLVATVGTELFQVMGARAQLGRIFIPAGEPEDVAVISDALWKEQFASRTNLDSLVISIQGRTYHVVGVMPPAMMYPAPNTTVWLPVSKQAETTTAAGANVSVLLRMRSGDAPGRVGAQLASVAAGVAHQEGLDHKLVGYRVLPLRQPAGPVRGIQKALGGASLLVLLVACLNLANLMLARGIGRRREVAVRMAVGASAAAIMRYVLTEAAVLAVGGGLWGVMFSLWGVDLVQNHMPPSLAQFGFFAPHVGWRVVAAGVLVTASTVLLAGMLPALHARRADVNDVMKDGGSAATGRRNRTYTLLAVGQVAFALMVMMGSGLLLRDVHSYSQRKLSFDAAHVLEGYVRPASDSMCASPAGKNFLYNLALRAGSVPGVRYASATARVSPAHGLFTSDVKLMQRSLGPVTVTTPDFFRAQGITIMQGRDFVPGDLDSDGAVILSQDAARYLYGLAWPIGRMLKLGSKASDAPWVRVVGLAPVTPDTINGYPVDRSPWVTLVRRDDCSDAAIYARTDNQDPKTPVALYHALRAAAPTALVGPIRSARGAFEESMASLKMIAALFTAFAVFGLALAAFGVYGVLSYVVSQRTREFAMRIALGAQGADLRRIMWREALIIALGGTAVGAWGAMWGGTFLADYLYNLPFTDVFALAGAEAVLIAIILLSCIAPVLRAMRADPVDLLRAM